VTDWTTILEQIPQYLVLPLVFEDRRNIQVLRGVNKFNDVRGRNSQILFFGFVFFLLLINKYRRYYGPYRRFDVR
ncbi:MAG: hypothetical protein ACWGQW_09425, partial [bacterium]